MGPHGKPATGGVPTVAPNLVVDTDAKPAGPRSEGFGLGRRLRQPRTMVSFVVPILLLVLALESLPGFEVDRLPGRLLQTNPILLALALACYYSTFPIRGYRWRLLLR